MKVFLTGSMITMLFALSACASQHQLSAPGDPSPALAFPGAEGFGKYTSGGRGGKVMIVTNLNDAGEGSFRKAATAKEKRIIVFAVSGTIHLQKNLSVAGDCTIAGQSAPGDGICIADRSVNLGGDNIIVRYLRFRMGDRYANKGQVDGAGSDDAFGGTHRKNILIDHCSMSWSEDEVFSVYAGDSTTLQWNIISEPLNYSYHFEAGDKDFEHHGFGGIWGGRHLSGHHNLFAHCNNRTPRFDGIRNSPEENADFSNNVIYNWGSNNVYAGEGGNYNIVNNYYRSGPETKSTVRYRIANPYKKDPTIPFGKFYVAGNFVEGSPENSSDNWKGIDMDKGTAEDKAAAKVSQPFPNMNPSVQTPADAYDAVLSGAGATLPKRDTLDERIITDVKMRRGNFINVQGNYPHGTAYELTVNAWPALQSLPAPADEDKDGIPDAWEKKHGLDAANAADAPTNTLNKSYSNIEVYLNSLVKN